ncbi:orotidine-5'-phosphate decarboxylase [Helicobacter sp.]|uniref:orotidine-5'-phosphate decarboxylase n=1 Tax=Helicobacter sp. TaxID=218 RepID=UPI0025C073DA|nr:orotidine-5'-phosphate decarboxylase [Helicobacter sp.]MCI5969058.1 orotidine-5'-phosphate decarboxylase [Helicobacter sp.]MDY2585354.1 orotidine-5'-phosphate decarboxylase [Helicobacter sp.]
MKLCIALDLPSKRENLALLESLKDIHSLWVKVGLRSFIRDGAPFLEEIKAFNPQFKIFLDLKLYDIPNTMGDGVESIAALNVDMLTIHASSGKEAMLEVMARLKKIPNPPLVMAVTALTSFDVESFFAIYHTGLATQVLEFAKMAKECGVNGVVCSCAESLAVKEQLGDAFLTLTPAIRPFGQSVGDQKRVATLQDAKDAKSDFIVVGRPIYQAENPKKVIETILENLE